MNLQIDDGLENLFLTYVETVRPDGDFMDLLVVGAQADDGEKCSDAL